MANNTKYKGRKCKYKLWKHPKTAPGVLTDSIDTLLTLWLVIKFDLKAANKL